MNTTTDEVKKMLLQGRHITKLDLFHESDIHSSCLPQRIYDIRHDAETLDWDIKSQSVKGKGTLREYWLEPDEIARIKSKNKPHQDAKFEQLGLGLPGTESSREWW